MKLDLTLLKLHKINEKACGNEYDYSYEYYYDWVLQYDSKKAVIIKAHWHEIYPYTAPNITEYQISEALGVPFESKLRKQLFKENTELFYQISNMHPELKKEALGGDKELDKVKAARTKVQKAVDELTKTIEKVERRRPLIYLSEY